MIAFLTTQNSAWQSTTLYAIILHDLEMRSPSRSLNGISRRSFVAAASAGILPRPLAGQGDEFRDVPNAYRMRMHWWVLGPAWTAEEAARQLAEMARAQLGGVLIFPAHPIAVDDPARGIRNQPYLSPEFLSVLRSVTGTARKLGLTVDIVLGTGWPYGGPSVKPAESARMLRLARIAVDGTSVRLPDLRDSRRRHHECGERTAAQNDKSFAFHDWPPPPGFWGNIGIQS